MEPPVLGCAVDPVDEGAGTTGTAFSAAFGKGAIVLLCVDIAGGAIMFEFLEYSRYPPMTKTASTPIIAYMLLEL